jgi:Mrp family chromosome partitioning ATPase
MAAGRVVAVTSARPDGATSVAMGLAGTLARAGRALLIDLNLARPEVAPILDLEERHGLYHLAYAAQLEAVRPSDLEEHVSWRDGLGIVAGIHHDAQATQVTDHFLAGLFDAARESFDAVVVDAGTVNGNLFGARVDEVLWVVTAGGRGLAAFGRAYDHLEDSATVRARLNQAQIVLNRVSATSFRDPEGLFEQQYGLKVISSIPDLAAFWGRVELEHSLRFFSAPEMPKDKFVKAYGADAYVAREAFDQLTRVAEAGRTPDAQVTEVAVS